MRSISAAFRFDAVDTWKSLRTALTGLAAVLLTATAGWATSTDFGMWGVLIIPVITGAIDAARRWLQDNGASP